MTPTKHASLFPAISFRELTKNEREILAICYFKEKSMPEKSLQEWSMCRSDDPREKENEIRIRSETHFLSQFFASF